MNNIKKAVIAVIIFYSLYVCYIDIMNNDIYNMLITLLIFVVLMVPKLLRKIFKMRISKTTENIYIIFIFLSHFLGSIVNLYDEIYWYDTFTHFLSGIICDFFILELMINLDKYDNKSVLFNVLFIFGMTFMIAGLWEDFEFISDKLFNSDAQKVLTTGVDDTMKDMIVASLGSLLFCIDFIFRKDEKNSIIHKFINNIQK